MMMSITFISFLENFFVFNGRTFRETDTEETEVKKKNNYNNKSDYNHELFEFDSKTRILSCRTIDGKKKIIKNMKLRLQL